MGRIWLCVHLAALAVWLGGSVGAWLVWRQAAREPGLERRSLGWLAHALRVTHGALALAVIAGVAVMVHDRIWPPPNWLLWKLVIVGILVIPLESVNAFIFHGWLARDAGDAPVAETRSRLAKWFTLAVPILVLAVLAIGALAVLKP